MHTQNRPTPSWNVVLHKRREKGNLWTGNGRNLDTKRHCRCTISLQACTGNGREEANLPGEGNTAKMVSVCAQLIMLVVSVTMLVVSLLVGVSGFDNDTRSNRGRLIDFDNLAMANCSCGSSFRSHFRNKLSFKPHHFLFHISVSFSGAPSLVSALTRRGRIPSWLSFGWRGRRGAIDRVFRRRGRPKRSGSTPFIQVKFKISIPRSLGSSTSKEEEKEEETAATGTRSGQIPNQTTPFYRPRRKSTRKTPE